MTVDPYNPLDLEALGESLLRQLERQHPLGLEDVPRFSGAGIYALYYCGKSHPYEELGAFNAESDCSLPIYVGRSVDRGSRRGIDPLERVTRSLLWDRIQQHRRSIASVASLAPADFKVRALVAMPIWVPLAEAMTIRRYRPFWNVHLAGFGIHAPGSGRQRQHVSEWDQLHPGRSFAAALRRTLEGIPESRLAALRAEIGLAVSEARRRRSLDKQQLTAQPPPPAEPEPRSRPAATTRPRRR